MPDRNQFLNLGHTKRNHRTRMAVDNRANVVTPLKGCSVYKALKIQSVIHIFDRFTV